MNVAPDASTSQSGKSSSHTWRDVLTSCRDPRVLALTALGFAAGLPFLLTGNTLGAWLRDSGTELAAIGFLSWVGLAYSFKFVWAPALDVVELPLIGKLGKRRSWIILAQLGVISGLFAMMLIGPGGGLLLFGGFALLVAFSSATQDIAIDAWRIEVSRSAEELGLLSAAYQLGYRAAMLITNAFIFNIAARTTWELSYGIMAILMVIGIAAALFAAEPSAEDSAVMVAEAGERPVTLNWTPRKIYDALINPFVIFFTAHGSRALLLLVAISLYRLPDFIMGPMVNPFYLDLGLTFMATQGPDLYAFAVALALENFSEGFSGTALIAWMSSLTTFGYAATQYALLSSFYTILGKILKGFSGIAVSQLEQIIGLIPAYAVFFACTAAIGIPSILVAIWAGRVHAREMK